MPKFRKKPIVIEAEQFFTDGKVLPFADKAACCFDGENWYVETIHNDQKVVIENGDWIIPEPNGRNFYPCKADIFEATYELVK